jgi:hypothetical protein
VITKLPELAKEKFGADALEHIMENVEVPCGGAYAVGNYDAAEVETLIAELSSQQNVSPHLLLHDFGAHLFTRFQAQYSVFLRNIDHTFDFLTHIHVEVLKLYPDPELPRFESSIDGNVMVCEYFSLHRLADLGVGLIDACIDHFGGGISVECQDFAPAVHSRFALTRKR